MAKRRKRTEGKYIVRRLALVLVILALVAGVVWIISRIVRSPEAGGNPPEESSAAESLPEEEKPESSEESPPPESSQPEESLPEESEPEPVAVASSDDDSWQLILASAGNPLPSGYAPPQLEEVSAGYQVDSRAAPGLRRMIADARLEGITLMVCSAYRAEDYQRQLHDRKIEEHKAYGYSEEDAVAAASAIVLPPGTSEHQTGLAADIVTPDYQVLDDGFAETPAAKWMAANSWKYGFVLRYPKDKQDITKIIYEPWHFRYVGEAHAKTMFEAGLCLEEYLYSVINPQRGETGSAEPLPSATNAEESSVPDKEES